MKQRQGYEWAIGEGSLIKQLIVLPGYICQVIANLLREQIGQQINGRGCTKMPLSFQKHPDLD